jgi:threonine aldolase
MIIDLRSDTVTKPSQAMREAMAQAPVGDDVYGEDPTINSLEERVANLFGLEAGLFTPSGSMANQLGIRLLVNPGEELLTEEDAHIVRAELGAGAAHGGITTRTWHAPRGLLDAATVLAMSRPHAGPYLVSTKAIALENTHNFGGGTVQPISEIEKLFNGAQESNISLHLDGARIWNAHIATGVSLKEYGKFFETISVCLSKGLGAPVGSVLLSSSENIKRARVWRKRLGGGMRQVGILGAACHFALDNNILRISEDHKHARLLADRIHEAAPSVINPEHVKSNIVGLNLKEIGMTSAELATHAKNENVLVSALGPHYARLVTHLDVESSEIATAADVLSSILKARK